MPLTLTPEQRQEALAKGYNPDEYVFLTPEEAAQTELLPETSAVGAAVRTAIEQAPGLATGLLAAKAGRALGLFGRAARLGSPAGIASVVAEPLVAMGAGYLGQKSVEALTDGAPWWTAAGVDDVRAARLRQEADMKQHPTAQKVGSVLGLLPLGAPIPSRAARSGIGQLVGAMKGNIPRTLTEAEKFAMAQMAVNPAAVAGVTVGVPLSQGQPVDPGFAAAQIALAALQGSPWRGEPAPPRVQMGPEVKMPKNLPDVIRAMRDRGMEITPETLRETLPGQTDELYRQMVGYAGEMQGPLIPQAGETQGPLNEVAGEEPLGPFQPRRVFRMPESWPTQTAEPQRVFNMPDTPQPPAPYRTPRSRTELPAGELVNPPQVLTPEAAVARPGRVITGQETTPVSGELVLPPQRQTESVRGESRWPQPETGRSPKVIEALKAQGFTDAEIANMTDEIAITHYNVGNEAPRLDKGNFNKKVKSSAIGYKARYQGVEQDPRVSLEQRLINERMAPAWNRLAAERGMAVEEGPVDNTGKHRGMHVPRSSVDEMSLAVVDPAREISTTRPHEQAHETMNFMQRFGSKAERARAQELLDAYGQDHEAMAETAAEQAIQLDIGAGRGNIPTNKLGRWQNFLRTWRLRFGKGSKEDLQNYMLEKMLNDPTYFERMGIPVPESVMAAAGGSGARMQDVKPQPEMSPEDSEAFRKLRQTVDEAVPIETKPGQPIDYAAGREAELRLRNRNARYQDVKPEKRKLDPEINYKTGLPISEPTPEWNLLQKTSPKVEHTPEQVEALRKEILQLRGVPAPDARIRELRQRATDPNTPKELRRKFTQEADQLAQAAEQEAASDNAAAEAYNTYGSGKIAAAEKDLARLYRMINELQENTFAKREMLTDDMRLAQRKRVQQLHELQWDVKITENRLGLLKQRLAELDAMKLGVTPGKASVVTGTPGTLGPWKPVAEPKPILRDWEASQKARAEAEIATGTFGEPVKPLERKISTTPEETNEEFLARIRRGVEAAPKIREVRSALAKHSEEVSPVQTERTVYNPEQSAIAAAEKANRTLRELEQSDTIKQKFGALAADEPITYEKFLEAVRKYASKELKTLPEIRGFLGNVSEAAARSITYNHSSDPEASLQNAYKLTFEKINKKRSGTQSTVASDKIATEPSEKRWSFSPDEATAIKEREEIEKAVAYAMRMTAAGKDSPGYDYASKEMRLSIQNDLTSAAIQQLQRTGLGVDVKGKPRTIYSRAADIARQKLNEMVEEGKLTSSLEGMTYGKTAEGSGMSSDEIGVGITRLERDAAQADPLNELVAKTTPFEESINYHDMTVGEFRENLRKHPVEEFIAKEIGLLDTLKGERTEKVLTAEQIEEMWHDHVAKAANRGSKVVSQKLADRIREAGSEGELVRVRGQSISSDRSPMRPSEINLSNPKDVYAPGEKSPSEDSLVGRDRLFGSVTDKVARTLGASGKIVSDVTNRTLSQARKEQHWFNEAIDAVKGLKDKEVLEVYKTLIAEDRSGEDYSGDLPAHLRPAYNEWRRIYRQMGEERLAAKQPVMGPDGKLRQRELLDSAFFNMTRRDVIEELNAHPTSAKSERLKADYINHQIKMLTTREGYTEAEAQTAAQERLTNYLDAIRQGGSLKESAAFSANRRTEGVGLPDSWIDPDPMNAWKRYVTRYAYDAAYWDNVETNPAAMKALGRSKNLYGQDVPFTAEHENIQPIGGPDVQYLEQAMQGKQNQGHNKGIDAFSNLVNTVLTPGWSTGIWDNITTVGKQMGYAKEQLPKLIGAYSKALGDLATGAEDSAYRRALSQGYIRKGRTIYEDLAEGQTAWADRWNKYANIIRKGNLREFSETISRTLSQAGGEVIGTAMRGAAEGGDKTAIDTLTRMWGGDGWKKATLAEIGTKFGEQVQGRYDVTELPRWAFDSALAPYVKMSRWNIGQGNNFVKYLLDPVYKNPQDMGAWTRLLTATLGSGLAGLAIAELKEQIGGRKQNIPTWDELAKADQRITQGTLLKLAVTSDLAGTFGMWGSLATMAQQKLAGNQAMGVGFPMADSAERIAKETSAFVSALIADPSLENVEDIMPRYVLNVGKTFVGGSSLIEGAVKRATGDEGYQTDLDTSNANRDMRMYSMLEEGKIKPSLGSNPDYDKLPERTFKRDRTPTMEESGHMAERIIRRAGGRPDKALEEMESLERMPVRLMPSMTSNPEDFIRYAKWLRETQGETAMRQRIQKYVAQQGLNEQKKAMLKQSLLSRLARR